MPNHNFVAAITIFFTAQKKLFEYRNDLIQLLYLEFVLCLSWLFNECSSSPSLTSVRRLFVIDSQSSDDYLRLPCELCSVYHQKCRSMAIIQLWLNKIGLPHLICFDFFVHMFAIALLFDLPRKRERKKKWLINCDKSLLSFGWKIIIDTEHFLLRNWNQIRLWTNGVCSIDLWHQWETAHVLNIISL